MQKHFLKKKKNSSETFKTSYIVYYVNMHNFDYYTVNIKGIKFMH